MLDIKWIRENEGALEKSLARRGFDADAQELLRLDKKYRQNVEAADKLRHERKQLSAQVAQARARQIQKKRRNSAKM